MNLTTEIQKLVNAHVKEIERDIVQRIVDAASVKMRAKPRALVKKSAAKSNGTSKPAKVATTIDKGCQGKLPGGGICGSRTHGLSRHNQAMTMHAKYKKATKAKARAAAHA